MEKIGIIGGGPAGLTAAIISGQAGKRVTLWEANKVDANINCAEGYFDIMDNYLPPKPGLEHKVEQVIIKIEEEHLLDTSQLNLWMVDRNQWQEGLKEKALHSGVKIKEGHMIKEKELEAYKEDYDWILDASGVPSVTSLAYGFREAYLKQALVGVQYRIEADFSAYYPQMKAIMLPNDFGYAWIFPHSDSIANIGLGVFKNTGMKITGKELYQKLDYLLEREGIKGDIIERNAGVCPNQLIEPLIYDNVILIGDAAGLTSPLHGGGLELARLSADLAVKAIEEKRPASYTEMLNKEIKDKQEMEEFIRNLWKTINRGKMEKLVALLSNSAVEVRKIREKLELFKKIGKWKVI